jgi:hypothetical protein
VASKDFIGMGCAKNMLSASYMERTNALHEITGIMTKTAFPQHYEVLRQSFAAANIGSQYKGPYLGRATLWKLQTDFHRDENDYLSCMTNSGNFWGGRAVIPQLGLALQ